MFNKGFVLFYKYIYASFKFFIFTKENPVKPVFALKTDTPQRQACCILQPMLFIFIKHKADRILKFQGFYPAKATKRRVPCCGVAEASRGCWPKAWLSRARWVTWPPLISFQWNTETELETLNRSFSAPGLSLI